jgi:hypothetical protein
MKSVGIAIDTGRFGCLTVFDKDWNIFSKVNFRNLTEEQITYYILGIKKIYNIDIVLLERVFGNSMTFRNRKSSLNYFNKHCKAVKKAGIPSNKILLITPSSWQKHLAQKIVKNSNNIDYNFIFLYNKVKNKNRFSHPFQYNYIVKNRIKSYINDGFYACLGLINYYLIKLMDSGDNE